MSPKFKKNDEGVHFSREKLGIVVFLAGLQLLPPLEERPECNIWLLSNNTLISVGPNLQTNERHTDVQSPVKLNTHTKKITQFIYLNADRFVHTLS